MPKRQPFFPVIVTLFLTMTSGAYAATTNHPLPKTSCMEAIFTPEQVRIIGADPTSQDVQDLLKTYSEVNTALNHHKMDDFIRHFSPKFISGDNLNLEQLKNLVSEAWEAYPDICSDSKPIEIRINGEWASIEVQDKSTATAPADKKILNVPGHMVSESRSVLYLKKMGDAWEITSDNTLWEHAIIRYGIGEDVQIQLTAPEQVKAGEKYSAIVKANVPETTMSIVTIDNQPLTYPHPKVDDKFRALSDDTHELQRVLTANTTNHNEIVTVTLGLTSIEQKDPERPSLALNGIATLIKRVNIVPISKEDVIESLKQQNLVKTSASGSIDVSTIKDNNANDAMTAPFELELVPLDDLLPAGSDKNKPTPVK